MAGSILESVLGMLGPQVVGPVASQLGESTETVQRGLQTGSAAMLAGLTAKLGQPGFLGQIFSLITNPANTPSALAGLTANPAAMASGAGGSSLAGLGGQFLSSIFGSNMSAVTDTIGHSTGLPSGKVGSLLSMAAPLLLGVLGQHVRQTGASAGGLADMLKAEAPSFQRFLPAGLGSLLGGSSVVGAVPTRVAALPPAASGNRWLWPVIVLAALVLGLWWFFTRSKEPVNNAVQTATNAGTSAVSALGDFFKTKLPDGVELNIPQFGIENKLISFLNDSSKPVDTTTWFNFDRLLFDTGKATLQPSSQEQLANIAAILKAYPNAHVKIGGYTDNTGDAAANVAL